MSLPDRETSAAIVVDVVSDVVCPWCFIGKRRLEKAVEIAGIPVAIRWRPFQLDPTIPPEGKDRRAYLEAKFGAGDRIAKMHEHVAELGQAEGIQFAFDRIVVSPNTLDAHRLIRWAAADGVQDRIVEALFNAYFIEGRNLGDHAVLGDIAAAVGMDRTSVVARLASEEDRAAVSEEIDYARGIGVSGVPTFVVGGRYALVGAQPPETIANALAGIAAQVGADDAAA